MSNQINWPQAIVNMIRSPSLLYTYAKTNVTVSAQQAYDAIVPSNFLLARPTRAGDEMGRFVSVPAQSPSIYRQVPGHSLSSNYENTIPPESSLQGAVTNLVARRRLSPTAPFIEKVGK